MRDCNRAAVIRRQVERLVAAAEKRAAKAEGTCSSDQFRPLTKAETESILGDELLSALGDARRRASLGEAREARVCASSTV